MVHPESYIGHILAGRDPGDINDWVERWHTSDSTLELHEYLGMTFEEYGNWVAAPAALDHIVSIRRMVDEARLRMTSTIAHHRGGVN